MKARFLSPAPSAQCHSTPGFQDYIGADGKTVPDEVSVPSPFKAWTPRLMRAAYNYRFSLKDPGVYTHNPRYVIQPLYDSLSDLANKVRIETAGMTRPK